MLQCPFCNTVLKVGTKLLKCPNCQYQYPVAGLEGYMPQPQLQSQLEMTSSYIENEPEDYEEDEEEEAEDNPDDWDEEDEEFEEEEEEDYEEEDEEE